MQLPYSEILNGNEYDFLKTNEHLGKHVPYQHVLQQ